MRLSFNPEKHRNELQISIEFSTQVLHNHRTLSEKQIAGLVHHDVRWLVGFGGRSENLSKYSGTHFVCKTQVTPIVRRIPSLISGLSIHSGMSVKTCGLRVDDDTIALGLDRRKIAKCSLSSKKFLMFLCLSVRSDVEHDLSLYF